MIEECDIVVIGAGPAGLAAAWAASQSGRRVTILDDNPSAGGQIWRCGLPPVWEDRIRNRAIEFRACVSVVGLHQPGSLLTVKDDRASILSFRKAILCTGARERFLPFPGWTLPNVFGAGGLQAMVKHGAPITGKRVVVAGSGPLLLAVAAYLKQRGARVLCIAEQARPRILRRFKKALFREPRKLAQAITLRWALLGVPYRADCWIMAATGAEKLEAVTLRSGGKRREIKCDYLACGYGLVPSTELAAVMGCRVDTGMVVVNHWQETTQQGVYCAGESTGIGGGDLALVEGSIAGYAAGGQQDRARALFRSREKANRFRRLLESTFRLRAELASLATPETILCRCEDVPLGKLSEHRSWRDAKLQTRCGMGPCQGRICGPAAEFLLGWPAESIRPPIFPVCVKHLLNDPS